MLNIRPGLLQSLAKTKLNVLLQPYSSGAYWLLFALCVKTLYLVLGLHYNTYDDITSRIGWGISWGDTHSYFDPIENLIKQGTYYPNTRLPGYGLIYLPLAILFSKTVACNIIIVLQLLTSSLSIYVLALSARLIFKNIAFFYATFYLYTFSCFTSQFDFYFLTESFATSALIFAIYYYILYFNSLQKKHLVLSGLFITWLAFLRPAYAALPFLFALLLFVYHLKTLKRSILLAPFLFLLPFVLTDGTWIIRNYAQYKKIMPLTATTYYKEIVNSYHYPVWNFNMACGLDYWRCNNYWLIKMDPTEVDKQALPFPHYIYTSKFNEDSLRSLKKFIDKSVLNRNSITVNDSMSEENLQIIRNKCTAYIQSIKTEKPLFYYAGSYCTLIGLSLVQSMFSTFKAPVIGRLTTIIYYAVTLLGSIGLLLIVPAFFKQYQYLIIPAIPLYAISVHSVIFRLAVNRYLVPCYPLIFICAVYTLYRMYKKFAH